MTRRLPLRVGLIGCGKVAINRHLPTIKCLKEATVNAVADINGQNLEEVANRFGISRRFIDYRELLNDESVEAVGVCVPLQSHAEVAQAVLDANKHLLLEKPLVMSLDEADRLIERARRSDRKVMLGFNKRWHRLVRRAKDIIGNGSLGPVNLVNTVFSTGHHNRFLPEWRLRRPSGGGALIENGSHFYDLWHFLLQADVEEVCAVSRSTESVDDEPSIVTARTTDGVFLNCVLSDFLPDQGRIEIFGRDCFLGISLYRFDGLEFVPLYSTVGSIRNRLGRGLRFLEELPQGLARARYGGDYNASYRDQWKHFVDCIQYDRPVGCTLEDGRRALRVALAAVKSASTGRSVRMSEAPRTFVPPEYSPRSSA